jgi:hypothetical protein
MEHTRGQIDEGMSRTHQVEVTVRHDSERCQRLIKQLTVLGCDDDSRLQIRIFLQRADDRGELDRFRSCAEDG